MLDTSTIGKKKVVVIFKTFFGLQKTYNVTFKVVDKESPVITYQNTLTTEKGKEIDLLKNVLATDNSRENITVYVEGEYNFNEIGEYRLYYVAKDSSGNEKKEEFTLKVLGSSSNETYFTTSKGFQGVVRDGATYINCK